MKYINKITFSLFLIAAFSSCKKEDEILNYNGDPIVSFNSTSASLVAASNNDTYTLEVVTTNSSMATVQISISDASTAIEGVHFAEFNKTVTIGQGEYVASVAIAPIIDNLEETKTLVLEITNSAVPEGVKFNQTFTLELSRFCALDISQWVGVLFDCDEPGYKVYDASFTAGAEPNTIVNTNFWDFGGTPVYTFDESASVDEAIVTLKEQTISMGGEDWVVVGSGTYEQCSRTMIINYKVFRVSDGGQYDDNVHIYTIK